MSSVFLNFLKYQNQNIISKLKQNLWFFFSKTIKDIEDILVKENLII